MENLVLTAFISWNILTKWEWISMEILYFRLCRKFLCFLSFHTLFITAICYVVFYSNNLNKFSFVGSCSLLVMVFVSFICYGFSFCFCSVIFLIAIQLLYSKWFCILHFSYLVIPFSIVHLVSFFFLAPFGSSLFPFSLKYFCIMC